MERRALFEGFVGALFHPIRHEQVRLALDLAVPVAGEDERLAVGENIGNPSKLSLNVICWAPVPSSPIIQRSKLRPPGSATFDA